MKRAHVWFVCLGLAVSLLVACRTSTISPSETVASTPPREAAATATEVQPTAVPALTSPPEVEATWTTLPVGDIVRLELLPIGEPGHYVNLTFGFSMRYPSDWYTGFGNRPILASFSNLDPGTHNRDSMRLDGCLIEVNVSANIFGFTPQQLVSQLARSMPNAEPFQLDGEPAMRARPQVGEEAFESDIILVAHGDRLFSLMLDHAKDAGETCREAWDKLIATWQWLEPDFVVYRNPRYGYAISYPRGWYRSDARDDGISISSVDPASASEAKLMRDGLLVRTDVHENAEGLALKEWLAQQDWQVDLSGQMPLDSIIGVRVLLEGPSEDVQQMSGYYQGPLGKIYEVTCLYRRERAPEFESIANAILYSFSF